MEALSLCVPPSTFGFRPPTKPLTTNSTNSNGSPLLGGGISCEPSATMASQAPRGATLARWFKNNKLADLEKAFNGSVHELYDHKDAVTMTDKLELLETLDKSWRGKRCSIVTLVLK